MTKKKGPQSEPLLITAEECAKKLIEMDRLHSPRENFSNWMEAAYCAYAKRTAPDAAQAAKLEERYMAIVAAYADRKHQVMEEMSHLNARLFATVYTEQRDLLGRVYMSEEVGLRSVSRGQFFTPDELCRLMARMTMDREWVQARVAQGRPITLCEPAGGSGSNVLAVASTLREMGFEPEQALFATLVDIDPLCMKMAFLQMTWARIPAVCVHGDSLALKEYERAVTIWALRQRSRIAESSDRGDATLTEPVPAIDEIIDPQNSDATVPEERIGGTIENAMAVADLRSEEGVLRQNDHGQGQLFPELPEPARRRRAR